MRAIGCVEVRYSASCKRLAQPSQRRHLGKEIQVDRVTMGFYKKYLGIQDGEEIIDQN